MIKAISNWVWCLHPEIIENFNETFVTGILRFDLFSNGHLII